MLWIGLYPLKILVEALTPMWWYLEMVPLGGKLGHEGRVFMQRPESLLSQTPPFEDTARIRPSGNKEVDPQQTSNLPPLDFRLTNCQNCEISIFFKSLSLWYFITAATPTQSRTNVGPEHEWGRRNKEGEESQINSSRWLTEWSRISKHL